MKIIHSVSSINVDSGGLGPIAIGLAEAQKTIGHDSMIWCLSSKYKPHDEPIRTSVITNKVWGPQSIGYSPAAERMPSSPIGANGQILHQHGIWMANSRVANRWRNLGKPTVIAPQGALDQYIIRRSSWKKKLALLAYESKNLHLATCIQATSNQELNSCREFGLRQPIAVIPNGISTNWFESTGNSDYFHQQYPFLVGKKKLLFLSRVHPKKGLPLLFNALSRIRNHLKDWCLVIAGPNEVNHQEELQSMAIDLQISNFVHFVGALYGETKKAAFTAADVFILPTHSEGAPMAVLESLAYGLPVITTKGAPWEELITYQCGWWVDIDSTAICDALTHAIQCPKAELKLMGQRGRNLIEQKYTWQAVAKTTIELYNWILGNSSRPVFVSVN